MAYVAALDEQRYEEALELLDDRVRVRGPSGETLGRPTDFIEMLRRYRGKYGIRKSFVDGNDVCLLYDLKTNGPTVFMSSWYQVHEGKIVSIHSVFDPHAFGPPNQPLPGNSSR